MKKYLAFSAKAFQRTLTYRFELWMELAINVLFMLIYVYLWKALYTDRTSVEGYDLNGILTYIVISQTLLTFVFTLRISRMIQAKVRAGEVATDLMKPIDFQMMTLATAVGTSIHTILFNMLPKVVLFYVIFKLSLPPSFLTVALFFLSASLGVCHSVQYRIHNRRLSLLAYRNLRDICACHLGTAHVVFRLLFTSRVLSRLLIQGS